MTILSALDDVSDCCVCSILLAATEVGGALNPILHENRAVMRNAPPGFCRQSERVDLACCEINILHDLAPFEAEAFATSIREILAMNSTESGWTFEAVQSLISLARGGVPVSVISLKLKRSSADVRAKLSDLGVTPPAEA